MTETGEHFADRAHRPRSAESIARIGLHRSRQAAFGAVVHPAAAQLAANVARMVSDPAARSAVPVATPGSGPGGGPAIGPAGPALSGPALSGPDGAGVPNGACAPHAAFLSNGAGLGPVGPSARTPQPGSPQHGALPPGAQHPGAQHPAAQHPAAQHPAAQHPAAQHPAAQHPAAQHPGVQHAGAPRHGSPHLGTLPPGTLPPGTLPPGNLPPGIGQPGIGQPRTLPPGTLPPGIGQPGIGQPRTLPPGALPPGIGQPGTGQPRTLPPGALHAGVLPPGALHPGALHPNTPQPNTPQPNTQHPGTLPPRTLPPGALSGPSQPGELIATPQPGPGRPAPGQTEPAGPDEESTVKLAPAPTPLRPRPSPRPRTVAPAVTATVITATGGSAALGLMEGPASATTKAPAVPAEAPEPVPARPGARADAVPVLHEVVALPAAPALVCDGADRIVQVNAALLRLTGHTDADGGLHGRCLRELVAGTDPDARIVRADGASVRVRVVLWDVPGRDLRVVVFVELLDAYAAEVERDTTRRWTTELERMARVGTWRYELATGTLHRSESLQQLYHALGVEPDASGGAVEGEQVALLVRALRGGTPPADHHAELRLPGGLRLSCRAEVETGTDGAPVRLTGVVRDVTAQHETEARARHAARRFADLAALIPTGLAIVDPDGIIREANPALCALLDVTPEQLSGLPAAALSADPVAAPGTTALDGPLRPPLPGWLRAVPPGAAHRYQVEAAPLLRGDGTTVWCELAVSATTLDDDGWLWLLACTDIGEKRRAAELLRCAGIVDELTRLPNRTATLELLEGMLGRPDRERVAVVCGDVDDFQRVNSSLGHEAGDDLLVTLAGRLQRDLPVGCTAARLAADEFVVVCSDLEEIGGADAFAAVVGELLRTTVTVRGRPVQLTASLGLAVAEPDTDIAPGDLLRFAEVAMHDAKRSCRGGMAVATERVIGSATRALDLEAELRAAIAADGLVLEYQPVVGVDGLVTTAEALVRWPHPERGVIPPADFLPVAQRGGMLRELDEWVLRTAAREAVDWPEHGGRPVAVAVNLAGLLPSDAGFRATVTEIVEAAGLPWDRLVLEVVETSLVALPPHALAAMDRLVQLGVRFAVDDFGTGYSSLARLKELPAQIVKVDRAFVTGVGRDPADFAVARAVVDMAKAMNRSTVAEGVETTEQYHVLRGVGVDAYQGWLFARPLPPWQLREVLAGDRLAAPQAPAVS